MGTLAEQAQEELDSAVRAHAPRPERRPNALLSRWALVTEWIDEAGDWHLRRVFSAGMAPWQEDALLHAALEYDLEDEDE